MSHKRRRLIDTHWAVGRRTLHVLFAYEVQDTDKERSHVVKKFYKLKKFVS